ncbi:hypothetical protein BB559_005087 [Furculomyces boomerangus]|uniref:Uncharacterized protein n=2 Tax=Harpellales TaxID=61421 RepID=A0A2T9YAW7_9FUNG|nr:hypothetical protein BB559_005087 [Furculomyces boomerangus]PWA01128.1 hypothetical protein BB558_002791 [Smittium angustum]
MNRNKNPIIGARQTMIPSAITAVKENDEVADPEWISASLSMSWISLLRGKVFLKKPLSKYPIGAYPFFTDQGDIDRVDPVLYISSSSKINGSDPSEIPYHSIVYDQKLKIEHPSMMVFIL